MKARKRLLGVLLGAVMTLAMTSAVFAAGEENGRPIPEILTVSEDDIAATPRVISELEGDGTKEDPYLIKGENDFAEMKTILSKYQGETNIRLEADIDLSKITLDTGEWSGYLKYFHGEFDGQDNTISGLPKNCYLIENWVGGTIKNLTLDLDGQAGTLVYCPVRFSEGGTTKYLPATLDGIKIRSEKEIQLTEGNKQANYAPFIFASGADFTMKNCTNYADISGNTYASVFYGYYPFSNAPAANERIRFENCANHGNVTYQYAGLLFGNPTGLFYKTFEFDKVKNYGELRGTESVHFFSSDANSIDAIPSYNTPGSFMYEQEEKLKDINGICDDEKCSRRGHEGKMCKGEGLQDISISVNKDNKFVVKLSKDKTVDHYKASAFFYVSVFKENNGEFISNGTNRMVFEQEFPSTGESFTVTKVRDYPIRDGKEWDSEQKTPNPGNGLFSIAAGTNSYYWLDNNAPQTDGYKWYLNGDRTPGSVNWQFYVSAYDAEGHLLDTTILERNEGE